MSTTDETTVDPQPGPVTDPAVETVDTAKHAAAEPEAEDMEFDDFDGDLGVVSITPRVERVPIPEWKKNIYVRAMTGTGRDAWYASVQDRTVNGKVISGSVNQTAKLVVRVWCNKDGELLYSHQDVNRVGQLDAGALARIFNVGARLSGLATTSVEDAEGNSDEESAASSSD